MSKTLGIFLDFFDKTLPFFPFSFKIYCFYASQNIIFLRVTTLYLDNFYILNHSSRNKIEICCIRTETLIFDLTLLKFLLKIE